MTAPYPTPLLEPGLALVAKLLIFPATNDATGWRFRPRRLGIGRSTLYRKLGELGIGDIAA